MEFPKVIYVVRENSAKIFRCGLLREVLGFAEYGQEFGDKFSMAMPNSLAMPKKSGYVCLTNFNESEKFLGIHPFFTDIEDALEHRETMLGEKIKNAWMLYSDLVNKLNEKQEEFYVEVK